MFFQNSLDNKFAQWGRSKQAMPSKANEIKEKVLATVALQHNAASVVRPSRFYLKIFSVGLAGLILFISINSYKERQVAENSSVTSYSSGYAGEKLGLGGVMTAQNEYSKDINYTRGQDDGSLVDTMAANSRALRDATEEIYPPMPASTPAAIDDREFMKYSYNANIDSRHVEEISTKILTIVRGYGGRVDSAQISDDYGHVSFVLPEDKLVEFKTEVKALIGKNFYSENLNLQNLLPEKVGLENSAKTASKLLSDSQDKLQALNAKHAKTIADLQRQLNGINSQIAKLKAETTTDPARQKEIKAEIASLTARQGAVRGHLSDENTWYGWDKTRLEKDVKTFQAQLDGLATQNKQLDENIATVQGSISVQWISIWEMFDLYLPYYWVWIIGLGVLIIMVGYANKRRSIII